MQKRLTVFFISLFTLLLLPPGPLQADDIIAGTAASSQHKLKVIVPVNGLSASSLYIEQATLINLISGPGTRKNTTLTRSSMISIE